MSRHYCNTGRGKRQRSKMDPSTWRKIFVEKRTAGEYRQKSLVVGKRKGR